MSKKQSVMINAMLEYTLSKSNNMSIYLFNH